MKKSNTPFGLSLPPEFKETVKRIKDKEPELDAMVKQEPEPDKPKTTRSRNKQHEPDHSIDTNGKGP